MPDPSFPSLHIRPERGWLNDPNGLCLIDGRYHVFFQYNPDSPVHTAIRWGHASSTDLLQWSYEPVALVNRRGSIDAAGCWTGCVVDDHGTPTAVYSAVTSAASDAQIALARSDRNLVEWQQSDHGVVGPPQQADLTEARDPFIFVADGHRYAIQGAGSPDGEPAILAYACDDLEDWQQLGTLLDYQDPVARQIAPANIWECPNLFQLGNRWVMIISSLQQGRTADTCYLIGDLDVSDQGLRFVADGGGVLDDGPSFYAPQVLVTPGRVLMWGWARDVDRPASEISASGWSGALTFPRELSVREDQLIIEPASELIKLRGASRAPDRLISARSFEVIATEGLKLDLVDQDHHQVVVDKPGAIRVLVDGSMIEVFGPGGVPTTVRAYPRAGSSWQARSDGDLQIHELALPDR